MAGAMNANAKRYLIEFGGSMAAYTVAVVVSVSVVQAVGPNSPWRWIALLPVLPGIAGLVAFIRFLRGMDELQRRIQFEALGIAFAASLLATFSYGFAENAGLPRLSLVFVAPFMIAAWGLATAVVSRRYA